MVGFNQRGTHGGQAGLVTEDQENLQRVQVWEKAGLCVTTCQELRAEQENRSV